MKKYCIRKVFKVNFFLRSILSTKKEQDKKFEEKNFVLETFNEENFLKVNIFWTSIYSQKKTFRTGKRDDDKPFEVKNIINVIFLFYDFAGKIRDWKIFKDRKFG